MPPLTLLLAGDVMTGRGIDQVLRHPGAPGLHEAWVHDARDYVRLAEQVSGPIGRDLADTEPWGDALALVREMAPRHTIANLETAVTAQGSAWPDKGVHYRMHPANVGCLRALGLGCCVLANNHVLDWGADGLSQTLQVLHAAGLATAGAGPDAAAAEAPAVLPLDGGQRLLVFAAAEPGSGVPADWAATARRPGVALLPELSYARADRLAATVDRHRRAGDLVLVSLHWGGNWGPQVPAAHRRFARQLIDRDAADVVHGHSSHHPLPVEVYRGRLILYGCGDLLNDYEGIGPNGELRSDLACLYFATLQPRTGRLQGLQIVPMQRRRFRLRRADAAAREATARLLAGTGQGFGTRLLPQGGDRWRLQWDGPPA